VQAARTTAREAKLAAALVEIDRVREILRQMRQQMQPLSASAQQRLDAAIRHHKQNLDAEFTQRERFPRNNALAPCSFLFAKLGGGAMITIVRQGAG
jgi:hypothetical protein